MPIRAKIIAIIFLTLSAFGMMTPAFAQDSIGDFTPEQVSQMKEAWAASGRSTNDFPDAVAAWSLMGKSGEDFASAAATAGPEWNPNTDVEKMRDAWETSGKSTADFQTAVRALLEMGLTPSDITETCKSTPADWDPVTQLTALQGVWAELGHNPEEFISSLHAWLESGKSFEEFQHSIQEEKAAQEAEKRRLEEEERLAQENARLNQQYNAYAEQLKKYHDLWDEVQRKLKNNEIINWDTLMRELGLTSASPNDIYSKLQQLNMLWQQNESNKASNGMSNADYMRWLLGLITDANGKTCSDYNLCLAEAGIPGENIINQPGSPDAEIKTPEKTAGFFNISNILDRFHAQIPGFIHLLFALSYTMGIVLVIISMMKFKQFSANASSMYYNHGTLTSPLSFLLAGIALMFLPSALETFTATFFTGSGGGDTSLFSYTPIKNLRYGYEEVVTPVADIVKIVGLLAFIRGWLMLAKMGDDEHKGAMFKGVVHVLGGILAVNIMSVYTLMSKVMGRLF